MGGWVGGWVGGNTLSFPIARSTRSHCFKAGFYEATRDSLGVCPKDGRMPGPGLRDTTTAAFFVCAVRNAASLQAEHVTKLVQRICVQAPHLVNPKTRAELRGLPADPKRPAERFARLGPPIAERCLSLPPG